MPGKFEGINIYDPWELAGLISVKPRASRFLSKRYGNAGEVEITEGKRVALDYKFGSTQIAPFVQDGSTGLALASDGYSTLELDVPNVGVKKNVTRDELNKRLAGEDPANPYDIPTRAQKKIEEINGELETSVAAREELMVADLLVNNGLTITERDDKTGAVLNTYKIDYLAPLDPTGSQLNARQKTLMTQAKGRASFTTSKSWGTATLTEIIQDLDGVVQKYAAAGIAVSELLITPDIWTALLANNNFTTPFQNAMFGNQYGDMNSQQLDIDAAVVAHLKVRGRIISLIVFDGTYIDNDGTVKSYLPENTAILTAPNVIKFKYGSHVIIPEGSNDFENITGARIPELYIDRSNSSKEYRLHSHPLAMPKQFASWCVMKVL